MEDTCHFKKRNVGATDVGFVNIKQGDEKALEAAVATVGPISVAINGIGLQFYREGIVFYYVTFKLICQIEGWRRFYIHTNLESKMMAKMEI